jgi:hypothetical protein
MPFRSHLPQAGVPYREQCCFGAGKEAVDGNEQRDDEETNGRISH